MRPQPGSRAVALLVLAAACGPSPPAPAAPVPPPVKPVPPPEPKPAPPPMHPVKEFLEQVKRECGEAFQFPDAEERRLGARLDDAEARPEADDREWAELQADAAKSRERALRLKSDPRYHQAETRRNWVRLNPMFRDVALTWVFADPYVIFQEVRQIDVRDTKRVVHADTGFATEEPISGTVNPAKVRQNEDWARKAELLARRHAIVLTELHRHFRELFAARLRLPTLQEKGRLLTGLVMWNRASFDRLMAMAGPGDHSFSRAFYSAQGQKFFSYAGDESFLGQDEILCAGGRVQKGSDQTLLEVGAHQLRHEYEAIFRGTPLKDEDTKVDDRQAAWFDDGLAEFLSGAEVEEAALATLEGAHWTHGRVLLQRIEESRLRRARCELWTLAELLQPNDRNDIRVAGDRLAGEADAGMPALFASRAWGFVHFLWNYDAGTHRDLLLQFLAARMSGKHSSKAFVKKVLKRGPAEGIGPIEMEFDWYWDRLLDRKVVRAKDAPESSRPSTDPPQGRVEDDAAFVAKWKAAHAGR